MKSAKIIGAGAFVVVGALLFTGALFVIGERRNLFESRFPLYTEFKTLGQLELGAVVRVAGLDAGEVTDIQVPLSPAAKFRVKMEVREDLHQLIRNDSVASTQTEGLVGAIFVNIAAGTEQQPEIPEGGTIPSREPLIMADLLQQASDTVALVNKTVQALRGDIEMAAQQIASTATDANAMLKEIRPEIEAMANNGSRISADTERLLAGLQA